MIEPARIQQIVEILRRAGLGAETAPLLREHFPDIHFTQCLDDDLGTVEPYHSDTAFNLYLVDGRDHCLKITGDPACATGLVLAEIEDAV